MHGVRKQLLLAQMRGGGLARRAGAHSLSVHRTQTYEARDGGSDGAGEGRGITHMIFGDLFLQDMRAYREAKLAGTGITPVFPLWLPADGRAGARDDRRRRRGVSCRPSI